MKSSLGKRRYPFIPSKLRTATGPESHLNNINVTIESLKGKIEKDALIHLPPVILVHQIYGAIKNRSWVDHEIARLKSEGKIVLLKLPVDRDDLSVALTLVEDLTCHIKKFSSSRIVHNFVDNVMCTIGDVSIEKTTLKTRFKLSENSIRELVRENILVIRDVGRFWLSFPNAGDFVKAYTTGRKYLLGVLQRTKYAEVLEADLMKRKLPKKATLGMGYYITDVIGSEDVQCVSTTSGSALRFNKQDA